MRKALWMLAALAAVGWMASSAVAGERDGRRRGPPPESFRDRDDDRDRRRGPPHHGPPNGRRPFGRRHVPPMFRELTDEQIEEILAFVKEKMPWRYDNLTKWQEEKPEFFRRMCRRLRFEIGQLKRLKKENPKAYEAALEEHRLRARAAELAARARQAESDEAREKTKAELRGVLERLFDAEGKAREAQIHELEERIAHLRRQLAERAEKRDRIIDWLLNWMMSRDHEAKDAPSPSPSP
jgi:polyhydroxyalkanoate synthesis regulator phasin